MRSEEGLIDYTPANVSCLGELLNGCEVVLQHAYPPRPQTSDKRSRTLNCYVKTSSPNRTPPISCSPSFTPPPHPSPGEFPRYVKRRVDEWLHAFLMNYRERIRHLNSSYYIQNPAVSRHVGLILTVGGHLSALSPLKRGIHFRVNYPNPPALSRENICPASVHGSTTF